MSQVPDNSSPPPISADIPRGKASRYSSVWKNLHSALEDSEAKDYLGKSEQGFNEKDGYLIEEKVPSYDEREEESLTPSFEV